MGCFLFSGAFWGILLILIGALIIIRVLFNINIPVFRIGLALLLIYFGIRVLVGGFGCGKSCDAVIFSESTVASSAGASKILFGKGVVDLSGISLAGGNETREISVLFGTGIVRIDPGMPVKIIVNTAFSGARMPDGNIVSFGRYTYTSKTYTGSEHHLLVHANVVFGGLEITSAR